jgi:hypothetical protein
MDSSRSTSAAGLGVPCASWYTVRSSGAGLALAGARENERVSCVEASGLVLSHDNYVVNPP